MTPKVYLQIFIFLSLLSYTMHRKRHLRLYNDSVPDFIIPINRRNVNSGLPVVVNQQMDRPRGYGTYSPFPYEWFQQHLKRTDLHALYTLVWLQMA